MSVTFLGCGFLFLEHHNREGGREVKKVVCGNDREFIHTRTGVM